MTIRTRRRDRPAGDLFDLTDDELARLTDDTGRPFAFLKPTLPMDPPRPDREAWVREMKRRGLDFSGGRLVRVEP